MEDPREQRIRKKRVECSLCKSTSHTNQNCPISDYANYRLNNPVTNGKNSRRCTLCRSSGHDIRNCDIKIAGEKGITTEDIINYYKEFPPTIHELLMSI